MEQPCLFFQPGSKFSFHIYFSSFKRECPRLTWGVRRERTQASFKVSFVFSSIDGRSFFRWSRSVLMLSFHSFEHVSLHFWMSINDGRTDRVFRVLKVDPSSNSQVTSILRMMGFLRYGITQRMMLPFSQSIMEEAISPNAARDSHFDRRKVQYCVEYLYRGRYERPISWNMASPWGVGGTDVVRLRAPRTFFQHRIDSQKATRGGRDRRASYF